jgi:hypothetical protein
MWHCTPVVPVLGRLSQKVGEFQANLGYMVRFSTNQITPYSLAVTAFYLHQPSAATNGFLSPDAPVLSISPE